MSQSLPNDKRTRTRDALLSAAQELLMGQSSGSLGIRQVTTAAGMVHGSFYNYYASIDALLEDLSALMFASHAALVIGLRIGSDDPGVTFSRITRQTLRMVPRAPDYGRLLFDIGLPVDRFVSGLRIPLRADINHGIEKGVFAVDDVEMAVSLVTGGVLGACLDLHRGRLPETSIEPITAALLGLLGVGRKEADRLANAETIFIPPLAFPLRWQAVPPPLRQALHAA